MSNKTWEEQLEENRFKTISDFKWCVKRGGEIEIEWNGKTFAIFSKIKKAPSSPIQIMISQVLIDNPEETERWYDTADELLEFQIDGERLGDIITKVDVNDRTI